MPKLLSSREVITTLTDHGFIFVLQQGRHQKYRNLKGNCVIVPSDCEAIPFGALNAIIRQSSLERELFFKS